MAGDDIQWVDDADGPDESDEVLPDDDRPALSRRSQVLIGAGVTLVVGLGVVAALVRSSGSSRPVALPSSSSVSVSGAPQFPAPAQSTVQFPSQSGVITFDPGPCADTSDGSPGCDVVVTVPDAATAALRTLLPKADVDGSTILGKSSTFYTRHLRAQLPYRALTVDICRNPGSLPSYDTLLGPGQYRSAVVVSVHGFYVLVTSVGPTGQQLSAAQLTKLGKDQRLLAGIT